MLNTEEITWKATTALLKLDDKFIGTPDYMGVTYFWAYEYRHWLRDSTYYRRRLVHSKFLKAGLAVDGEGPEHLAIVERYASPADGTPNSNRRERFAHASVTASTLAGGQVQ
jgi:hypothetical protein